MVIVLTLAARRRQLKGREGGVCRGIVSCVPRFLPPVTAYSFTPTEFLHGSQNISETNIHNDKYNIDEVLNRDS